MRDLGTPDHTACKEFLASTCLLPPHPHMKVVWGGVSEGVIPYAFSCIFMLAELAEKIENTEYNKPSNGRAKRTACGW